MNEPMMDQGQPGDREVERSLRAIRGYAEVLSDIGMSDDLAAQGPAINALSNQIKAFAAAPLPAGSGVAERLTAAILDIDAHATPLGEDADGFVSGGYLVTTGALHRALGVIGRSAPMCATCGPDHRCQPAGAPSGSGVTVFYDVVDRDALVRAFRRPYPDADEAEYMADVALAEIERQRGES